MPIKRESWLCEKWVVWIELFLSFLGLSNGLINNKKIEFEIDEGLVYRSYPTLNVIDNDIETQIKESDNLYTAVKKVERPIIEDHLSTPSDIWKKSAYGKLTYYINSNVSSWTAKGSKVYFVSVNPCDGGYSHLNSQINSFNNTLKSGLSKNVKYIDTNSSLSFTTTDGLHYNESTSKGIYNYIKRYV